MPEKPSPLDHVGTAGGAQPIIPTPPPPPPPPVDPNAPDHRITVKFSIVERGWKKLATPIVATFDSGAPGVHLFPQDHFLEGHAIQDATGHIWRSWLQPMSFNEPERCLRITWWHYKYSDGTWWIAGAVLNDSIEAPLPRMRGVMEVNLCDLDGKVRESFPSGVCVIALQEGYSFSFGAPARFLNFGAAKYWIQNFGEAGGVVPPDRLWEPVTAPDRIGGNGPWQAQWTPRRIDVKKADGSYQYPRYWDTSDPRNPPIGATIGEIEVPDLYNDQTHAHHREVFRSPYETGWQAHERANNNAGVRAVLRALWQWSARQVGSWSPKFGPPYWIPGRPAYLAGLDGWMPDAETRYKLTGTDAVALKPWIGHEGRVEITKGNLYQFPECFGQDSGKPLSENAISALELAGGRYSGGYSDTQAWDLEHGGAENLAAAAILLADPLAMHHLHHWCEEYITNGIVKHSSRSSGWMIEISLYGWLCFKDKPSFRQDAERYLAYARSIAQWVWQARLDETAYQGLLGRNYSGRDLSIPEEQTGGFEGAFGSAIALNAFCMGAQVDPNPAELGLWLDLVEYTANLFLQPGIIQRPSPTFKGGVLDSWNLFGPKTEAEMPGKTIDERLRANSGAYSGVDWLADQGWSGPALSKASRVLKAAPRASWAAIDALAKEIRGYQILEVYNGNSFLSPKGADGWAMYFEQAATYGWPK